MCSMFLYNLETFLAAGDTVSENEYHTPSKEHYENGVSLREHGYFKNPDNLRFVFKEFYIFPKSYCKSL